MYKSIAQKKYAVARLVLVASLAELTKAPSSAPTQQLNDLFEALAFSDALSSLAEIVDEWDTHNGEDD